MNWFVLVWALATAGVKAGVVVGAVMLCMAYMTWVERRAVAFMQYRKGPNRVGWFGLLQPFADGLKIFLKEDLTPAGADKVLFTLAPILVMTPALFAFSVIPFGPDFQFLAGKSITIFGFQLDFTTFSKWSMSDLNIGVLFFMGVAAMAVYGAVLAGWSSNGKYSLLGGLRAGAQMISYELALTLSVMSIVLLAGSLNLRDIVAAQDPVWYVFLQPIGFIIFLICMLAETNRSPFDLAEAESELVAGFHTEYSSMKFAMFFMGEYAAMIGISSFGTTLFLGGFNGPFFPSIIWFVLKTACLLFLFIWVRATLPRFRYDQLMKFGWNYLIPISLINLVLTAFFVTLLR